LQFVGDPVGVAEKDGRRDAVVGDGRRLGKDAGGATHVAPDAGVAERVDQLGELVRARVDFLFQSGPA